MDTGFAAMRPTVYRGSGTGPRGIESACSCAARAATPKAMRGTGVAGGGSRRGRSKRSSACASRSLQVRSDRLRRTASRRFVPARGRSAPGSRRGRATVTRVVRHRPVSSPSGCGKGRPRQRRGVPMRPLASALSDPRACVFVPDSSFEPDGFGNAITAARCRARPLCTPEVDVRRGLFALSRPLGDTTADQRREAAADAALRFSVYAIGVSGDSPSLLVHRPRSYIETRLYKKSPVSGVQSC